MNKNELTDEKIGVLIDQKAAEATSWYSSQLSRERGFVLDYINRKLPKQQHEGGSRFVTAHVYNAVEMMRAQLAETFSAGSGMVSFDARHPQDVETARIATEYTNHVFYKLNNGESIIRDAIFDGLTARVGIAKVWWDKDEDEEELEFENVTEADLQAWDMLPQIVTFEAEPNEDGTFSGKLVRRIDKGQVKIEVINPEEFAIERHAQRLSDEYFCVHRTVRTIDWITANYPKMKGREDELRGGVGDDLTMSPEVLARFEDVDASSTWGIDDGVQDELRKVIVYEAYCKFQRKGDLTARLYKVLRCGRVNIEIAPIDTFPFVVFTPIPRPHKFYGENYARTVVPTQNAQTAAVRAIIDAAMQATNPRWMVEKGGLLNPRELLENRLGGIVNVKSLANSVAALPQQQINPQLFSLMQGLNTMNEEVTGITAQQMGMNGDMLNHQNSTATNQMNLSVSQTRQKEMARIFVDQFLIPLFCKIYDLVVRYERREDVQIVTDSGWIAVNPWDWSEGRTATAAAHLGYGEKMSKATEVMMLGEKLASNPVTAQFVGPAGAYAMAADVMTLMGRRSDISRYMPVTPDKIQPPQPNPLDMAKAKNLEMDGHAKIILAQAQAKKVEDHLALNDQKMRMNAAESDLNLEIKRRDADRKDRDVDARIMNSQIETALLVEASEGQDNEPAKPIISP